VDSKRIVLAFNGDLASCVAVKWLADTHAAEVVTLTVDVGQHDDPEETYSRALACGAHRAHVLDRCEDFARQVIVPVAGLPRPREERERGLRYLAYPVTAAALAEVAAIEQTDLVAHASLESRLDKAVHAVDSTLRVYVPARAWLDKGLNVAEYVKMHRLPAGAVHPDRNLLMRPSSAPAPGFDDPATVTIDFEAGVPVSVNGVAMQLPELIESLSLIGGRYSLARSDDGAPALTLLRSAYGRCEGRGSVTLQLNPGSLVVSDPEPVNHA
jgi:argininosuccinate synthase